jgi:hypothetical protein
MMRAAVLAFAFVLACGPALADPPCGKLAWPLEHEQALLKGPLQTVASGGTLQQATNVAFALALKPPADAKLPQPTGRPADPAKFAGFVQLPVPLKGDYLVSLSGEGWIDVYQGGASIASTAHTGDADCPGLRKSVRFPLANAPVLLQISNAPTAAINIAVTPAR